MRKDALGSYCPRCGKDVSGDIIRCSNCGTSVASKLSLSPLIATASIFCIVAACISLFEGIYGIVYYYDAFYPPVPVAYLSAGILGVLGFAFGLASGVLSLARIYNWISLFGMTVVIAAGVVPLYLASTSIVRAPPDFLTFGIPIAILGILSIIFTLAIRRDFENP